MSASGQINRIRGDTYADRFLAEVDGVAVDITGCSFKLTLNTQRNPIDISNQVYQLTGIVTSPESGIVEFAPDSTQADLTGLFYYDIQMIDGNGVKRTPVKDVYVYEEDITKN